MQTAAPDRDDLRRLAELRLDRPVVLSLYLNLDPSEFATAPARSTAVRSLLDDADRRVRERELPHPDRAQVEASLGWARGLLENDLPADGAHALALFGCEPAELYDVLKLPRAVSSRVSIGHTALVGPLAWLERRERWCVTLVSRRDARLLRGSPDGLREIGQVHDDVHGQHDQGGLSQGRYQRGIEKEKDDHLKRTGKVLLEHFKRRPFERLVVGGPREVVADFEGKLHGFLAERLAGRIDVDVKSASPEQVLEAARPCFDEQDERREAEALERLGEGSHAAVGLPDTLQALNERRVEVLMADERFEAPGVLCPDCGWIGPDGETSCPVDGSELASYDDVIEPAIELAVQQSADVLGLRHRAEELRERGGIAALLRF